MRRGSDTDAGARHEVFLRSGTRWTARTTAPAVRTRTGPGGQSSQRATRNPVRLTTTPIPTAHRAIDFSELPRRRAASAGSRVRASTSRAPVSLIAPATAMATRTSSATVSARTGTPEHWASSRSYSNSATSLRRHQNRLGTTTASTPRTTRSAVPTERMDPHNRANAPEALTPETARRSSAAAIARLISRPIAPDSPSGVRASGATPAPDRAHATSAQSIGSRPVSRPTAMPSRATCIIAKRTGMMSSPTMITPTTGRPIAASRSANPARCTGTSCRSAPTSAAARFTGPPSAARRPSPVRGRTVRRASGRGSPRRA